jgi:ABC-type antimicrobial peptide transport system permease subunit
MRVMRTVGTAMRALRRNVARAILTAVGIIIGVAAVIAMMEIGNGSSTQIQKTIASMGANNLLVQPGAASSGGVSYGGSSVMTLTPEDCEAMNKECPAVRSAAPIVRVRTQVIYGNRNWVPMYIYGTTPAFLDVRDWSDLDSGECFSDRDVRNASKVCLLGKTIERELFQGEPAVGKEVRVQNVALRVVGVLSRKGANTMGFDQDDVVLAPWTTIKSRVSGSSAQTANQSNANTSTAAGGTAVNSLNQLYPGALVLYPAPSATQQADSPMPVRFTNVDQITLAAVSGLAMPQAITQVSQLLRERHRLRPGVADDFNVRDMTEMSKALSSTTGVMTQLLLVVALISLVVGGVGIMNIMLVSVTERTREIGLRMAVGARARDILRQFLVEAVVLCVAGGTLGIALGIGSSWIVSAALHWPTESSPGAVVAAFAVSATVGIVFGWYPAWKASRLDPIEALRYE